jgi:hypothetical protein
MALIDGETASICTGIEFDPFVESLLAAAQTLVQTRDRTNHSRSDFIVGVKCL